VSPSADLPLLLRLVVAGILAAILGWERQTAGKEAGLSTHMLAAIGAALFVELAQLTTAAAGGSTTSVLRLDPIQAVAAGIGFIGAGIIFKSSDHVQGLTTAAAIWATAAVGFACGIGHYALAVGATVLLFVVLRLLKRFEGETGGNRI